MVTGFIRVRVGPLGSAYGSSGYFVFACVQSGMPRVGRNHSSTRGFSLARIALVVFIWISMGSLLRAKVLLGSIGFAWVHWGGRGVVWFIRVRVCSLVHS